MNNIVKNISSETGNQLIQLSEIVHDKNISPEKKKEKLDQILPEIKAQIEAELKKSDRLLAGANFLLVQMEKYIASGDFEKIPEPKILRRAIEDLTNTMQALSACLVSSSIDMGVMFKALLDLVSNFKKFKAEDFREHMLQTIAIAVDQKAMNDKAADTQQNAEVTQSVTAIATQIVSIAVNSVLIGMDSSVAKKQSKNASDMSDLDDIKLDIEQKKLDYDIARENVAKQKNQLGILKRNNANSADVKKAEALTQNLDKAYRQVEADYKSSRNEFKSNELVLKQSDITLQSASARNRQLGQVNQSSTQIFQSIGNISAAGERQIGAKQKNLADFTEAQKELIQSLSQSNLNSLQKLTEFINQVLQAINTLIDKDDQMMNSVLKG